MIFSCVSFPPPLSLPFPKKRWQGVATLFGKLWTRRRSWRSMLLTIWQLWFRRVMRTDVFYRIKSTNFELFWTRTCPLAKEDAISRGDLYRCLFDIHNSCEHHLFLFNICKQGWNDSKSAVNVKWNNRILGDLFKIKQLSHCSESIVNASTKHRENFTYNNFFQSVLEYSITYRTFRTEGSVNRLPSCSIKFNDNQQN